MKNLPNWRWNVENITYKRYTVHVVNVATTARWHMPVDLECVLLDLSVSTFSVSVISCTALVQMLHKKCVEFWLVCSVMIHMNEVTACSRQFTQKCGTVFEP